MKKTTLLIIGCILMSSIAFGMGQVGAETVTTTVEPTLASTPITTPTPQARIQVIEGKNHQGAVIEFVGLENEVIKRIELDGKVFEWKTSQAANKLTAYYHLPTVGIVVAHINPYEPSAKVIYETGLIIDYKNNIEYYDVNGKLLFEKKNANYSPLALSYFGKYILCYRYHVSSDDAQNYSIKTEVLNNNLPEGKIIILDKSGNEIFSLEEFIDTQGWRFSRNDEWLIYRGGPVGYRLISMKERAVKATIPENDFGPKTIVCLFNDGKLLLIDNVGRKRGDFRYQTEIYNPFNKSYKTIAVFTSNELDAYINKIMAGGGVVKE